MHHVIEVRSGTGELKTPKRTGLEMNKLVTMTDHL